MQVALDQIPVSKIDRWRDDNPVDQILHAVEEVLIVRALGGAVGQDQGRLATATGASAALRIVGCRRRRIPKIDDIHGRNVDAKLHGRRAKQRRQETRAFAMFPQFILSLIELLSIVLSIPEPQLA